MIKQSFTVTQTKPVTYIENNSTLNLIVSIRPIKPKRKHHSILVIKPGCFIIDENNLVIEQLSFSLE